MQMYEDTVPVHLDTGDARMVREAGARFASDLAGIMPVNVVEFWVWAEVATGQAAWGVTWVSSACVTSPSIVGGASNSVMASTCMYRCWIAHSSLASSSTAPMGLRMPSSLGDLQAFDPASKRWTQAAYRTGACAK